MHLSRYFIAAIAALAVPAGAQAYTVNVDTPTGRVQIDALTNNVIRVTQLAPGERVPVSRASVLDASNATAQVVANSNGPVTNFTTATGVNCTVDRTSGAVTISAGAGRIVADPGVRTTAGGKRSMQLFTTSTGSFYGAGERGHKFNLRGDTLVNYNRQNYGYTGGDPRISQMNITMPLFLSSDGFALVFDDYAASTMVLSNPITYTSETKAPISYYFVNGVSNMAQLTTELTSLTGRQPLPPLWSLGYITSKYGYRTQAETLGTIDTLKRQGYPVDGIVLDLYWYGKEQDMGRLDWDPQQWPNHRKMLKQLKDKGVNLVAISQPYVLRNGRGLDNYNMGDKAGLFVKDSVGGSREVKIWVGEGGMWDMSNPDTRAWLRERYRTLTEGGVGGWWGDLGEPEVHPDGFHANGLTTRQYHNQYGNDWSEIISELFREEYPDTRLMTMMRGGTTGLQRYSVYPWSTDVSRSWGGLQPQITIMLNSGLSGLGYMGHDVGGFAVDPAHPYDPELYVRWLQLGTFSPILRTHAQFKAEPYNYPDQKDIVQGLIRERYVWLPYNYTLAYENATKGWPLVRPLDFASPKANSRYDNISDEYLWGADVLIAPVLQQGVTERKVTLPYGRWYDYAQPVLTYAGESDIIYPVTLATLPIFVREGAFIPQTDGKLANTGQYNPGRLTVKHYRSNKAAEYTLYDDNRMSARSLAEGQYMTTRFTAKPGDDRYVINVTRQGSYAGAPTKFAYNFELFGFNRAPQSVMVDGRKVAAKFDAATGCISFPTLNASNIVITL